MKKSFKQNDNNNAICYYRFSSRGQNEQSIDQQREQAELYAEAHGLTIVKEYWDAAISGTEASRPQYQLMLSEVTKIKPAVLIIYKTDRLARDKFQLVLARKIIRDAGCSIECVAEPNINPDEPMSVFIEGSLDAMAEFYSLNLSQQVKRGIYFNASRCLFNGHKLLGYSVDSTKHYIIDEDTAPIVLRIFNEYANGKGLKQMADDLNGQGIRTVYDTPFTFNGLRGILKNRAYIGEYHFAEYVVPDGMPRIISDELFDEVQRRFELNKHKSKSVVTGDVSEPRFWLTGKLFCGECGERLCGTSGTSHLGNIYYYYSCANHRRHKCKLKNIRQDILEDCVTKILRDFLSDPEELMSLAVDVSDYAKKLHSDDNYLKSLERELKNTTKSITNIVDAIKKGGYNQILQDELNNLGIRKEALEQAIETEKIKLALAYDDHSIRHYFEMYAEADFDDVETRDRLLNYFIDKIYVFEDKLVVDLLYSDDHREIDLKAFLEYNDTGGKVRTKLCQPCTEKLR